MGRDYTTLASCAPPPTMQLQTPTLPHPGSRPLNVVLCPVSYVHGVSPKTPAAFGTLSPDESHLSILLPPTATERLPGPWLKTAREGEGRGEGGM